MKNKKGEGEFLFLFMIILLIFGTWTALSNTEYDSFMKDCKQIHDKDFQINSTCWNGWNENGTDIYQDCKKTNKEVLKEFCQDKWLNTKEPKTEVEE